MGKPAKRGTPVHTMLKSQIAFLGERNNVQLFIRIAYHVGHNFCTLYQMKRPSSCHPPDNFASTPTESSQHVRHDEHMPTGPYISVFDGSQHLLLVHHATSRFQGGKIAWKVSFLPLFASTLHGDRIRMRRSRLYCPQHRHSHYKQQAKRKPYSAAGLKSLTTEPDHSKNKALVYDALKPYISPANDSKHCPSCSTPRETLRQRSAIPRTYRTYLL